MTLITTDAFQQMNEFLAVRGEELTETVAQCVADVLRVDRKELRNDFSLVADLGADSLDIVALELRLEEELSTTLPPGGLRELTASALGVERGNSSVSAEALERLQLLLLPESGSSYIDVGLTQSELPTLFTVMTIVRVIAFHLTSETV